MRKAIFALIAAGFVFAALWSIAGWKLGGDARKYAPDPDDCDPDEPDEHEPDATIDIDIDIEPEGEASESDE